MDDRARLDLTAAAVEREAARYQAAPRPPMWSRRLFFEEVHRSTALAGSALTADEVRGLVERDVVAPGRTLAENVLVADYGEAARLVRGTPPPRRRTLLALDEIAHLHALAVRRTLGARPGRWREATAPAFPSGMVPPPAWMVPRQMDAFAERFATAPQPVAERLLWVADAHERFARIHPFDRANGRTGRLVTNLLLRRLGLPPFVVRRRDASRYVAALRRADSRDPVPLAIAIGTSLLESYALLVAEAGTEADAELAPLATFAAGPERAALYKAAQRGRLRVVPRAGALLTKRAWIDEYRARARRRPAAREQASDGHDPRDAEPR